MVGVTILGESINLTMNGAGAGQALFDSAGLGGKRQSMELQLKDNETSTVLRVIVDDTVLEAFAMHGRAGVSARASTAGNNSIGLVLAGEVPSSVDVSVFPLAWR